MRYKIALRNAPGILPDALLYGFYPMMTEERLMEAIAKARKEPAERERAVEASITRRWKLFKLLEKCHGWTMDTLSQFERSLRPPSTQCGHSLVTCRTDRCFIA
jgi:hypothetical protein